MFVCVCMCFIYVLYTNVLLVTIYYIIINKTLESFLTSFITNILLYYFFTYIKFEKYKLYI